MLKINARIITATNKNLEEAVVCNAFRRCSRSSSARRASAQRPAAARSANQMTSPTGRICAAGKSVSPDRILSRMSRLPSPATRNATTALEFERRIGEGDPLLLPALRHRRHPLLALLQHRFARQQRGRVAVLAEAEQSEVEKRPVELKRVRAVEPFQHGLIRFRRFVERHPFGLHGMHVLRGHRHVGEEGGPRHAEIAGRIRRRHEALVAENPMHPVPGQAGSDRLLGEELVERLRRIAPGERDDGPARIAGREIAEIRPPRPAPRQLRPRKCGASQMQASWALPRSSRRSRPHVKGKKLPLVIPAKAEIQ